MDSFDSSRNGDNVLLKYTICTVNGMQCGLLASKSHV